MPDLNTIIHPIAVPVVCRGEPRQGHHLLHPFPAISKITTPDVRLPAMPMSIPIPVDIAHNLILSTIYPPIPSATPPIPIHICWPRPSPPLLLPHLQPILLRRLTPPNILRQRMPWQRIRIRRQRHHSLILPPLPHQPRPKPTTTLPPTPSLLLLILAPPRPRHRPRPRPRHDRPRRHPTLPPPLADKAQLCQDRKDKQKSAPSQHPPQILKKSTGGTHIPSTPVTNPPIATLHPPSTPTPTPTPFPTSPFPSTVSTSLPPAHPPPPTEFALAT